MAGQRYPENFLRVWRGTEVGRKEASTCGGLPSWAPDNLISQPLQGLLRKALFSHCPHWCGHNGVHVPRATELTGYHTHRKQSAGHCEMRGMSTPENNPVTQRGSSAGLVRTAWGEVQGGHLHPSRGLGSVGQKVPGVADAQVERGDVGGHWASLSTLGTVLGEG